MNTTTAIKNAYLVHLVRIDGKPIDTETGTLTFSHGVKKSRKSIEKKFNRRMQTKGYIVDRIEVYQFSE